MIHATVISEIDKALKVIPQVMDEWKIALFEEGETVDREFAKTYATWKVKPKFKKTFKQRPQQWTLDIFTENKIYFFLAGGTSHRWAVMSADWESKTVPRLVGSRPGRGTVVIRGKRAMTSKNIEARPGIAAREWPDEIAKQRAKPFQKRMDEATERGLKKAGVK